MNELKMTVKGIEVNLATTLRVAYNIQSKFGHKPYTQIFAGMHDLDINDQVKMLFEAYMVGNPKNEANLTELDFRNEILDGVGGVELTFLLTELVNGVMYGNLTPPELKAKKLHAQRMDLMEELEPEENV